MIRIGRLVHLTVPRLIVSIISALVITLAAGGPYGGAVALADDPSASGPVPADGQARIGKGLFDRAVLSPDERRLAVSTQIGVYMYDTANMQQMWYSEGYDLLQVPIAFSADSKRLVGGHNSNHIVGWDVESGAILANYDYQYGAYDVAYSGDGKYVVGASGGEALAWDAASGNLLYVQNDFHSLLADVVTTSPDGKMFATGGLISDFFDEITVWDVPTGTVLHTFKVDGLGDYPTITAMHFTPDNKILVAGSDKGYILAWDLDKGKLLYKIQDPDRWVDDFGFSPDGSLMAVGGYHVHVYRTFSGMLTQSYDQLPSAGYGPWFSQDGTLKTLAFHSGLFIMDVASGAELGRVVGHEFSNGSAALTPDGSALILGQTTGMLQVRDTASKSVIGTLTGNNRPIQLVVSPDGGLVAGIFLYSQDDIISKVVVWDLKSGQKLYEINDNDNTISDIQFTADSGSLLVSQQSNLIRRLEARSGQIIETYAEFLENKGRLLLAPNSTSAVVILGDKIEVWDLATASETKEFPIGVDPSDYFQLDTAGISADGTLLAAGDSQGNDSAVFYLWNLQTGQLVARYDDGGDHGPFAGVYSFGFNADDSTVAAGLMDGTIVLADARSGQVTRTLRGHGFVVAWLGFMPQTGHLVSVSADATTVFWNVP